MALERDVCTPDDFDSLNWGLRAQASQQTLVLIDELMTMEPYTNLIESGTREAGLGEVIQHTIPGRPVLNQSMTIPEKILKSELCGIQGPTAAFGSNDYSTRIYGLRGRSPDLCIHQLFTKLEGEAEAMQNQFRQSIREMMAADVRAAMLQLSGTKFTALSTVPFQSRISGGDREVQVDFPAIGEPDAYMSWGNLTQLDRFMRETNNVQPWGEGDGAYALFIASSSQIEHLRNQASLKNEVTALVQGGNTAAQNALRSYTFTNFPYRGIKYGTDYRPLRFNVLDGDGFPVLIEPYVQVAADDGVRWAISTEWVNAQNEVSFLIYKGTLKKITPARYTRAGAATWPTPVAAPDIDWFNVASNGCNERGDTGHFNYGMEVGYQTMAPWGIAPILSRRCKPVDDLEPCVGVSESES